MSEYGSRSVHALRNSMQALDRARQHNAPSLRSRVEYGPRHFARGLGIAALTVVPERVDGLVQRAAIGISREFIGVGGESLVFREPGDNQVTKLTDVTPENAEATLSLLELDLAIAQEVFGDMVPSTEITGIEYARYGALKGLFIVQKQDYVAGRPLLHQLEDVGESLRPQIANFLEGLYEAMDTTGRIPDIIAPENLVVSHADSEPKLQLLDYSMHGLDCELRQLLPTSWHQGEMQKNLSALTNVVNPPIE